MILSQSDLALLKECCSEEVIEWIKFPEKFGLANVLWVHMPEPDGRLVIVRDQRIIGSRKDVYLLGIDLKVGSHSHSDYVDWFKGPDRSHLLLHDEHGTLPVLITTMVWCPDTLLALNRLKGGNNCLYP